MLYDENFLNEEQQKIEDCYTEIGRQYYAAHKNDAEPELPELFDAVKKSEKAMADHKAEVLRANGLMLCPRCGEQIYYKSNFCNFCGIRIVDEKPADESEKKEPEYEEPSVEEIVSDDAQTGAVELDEAPEQAEPEQLLSEPNSDETPRDDDDIVPVFVKSPTKPYEPQNNGKAENDYENDYFNASANQSAESDSGKIICPVCKRRIDADCIFCVECGAPLSKSEDFTENASDAPVQNDSVRVCEVCGYTVTDPEAVFCNSCGSKLGASNNRDTFASAAKRPKKTCSRCGFTTDDPEVMFCIECGQKLR